MKFCDEHWERLKDAIRQVRLWSLVAESGEEGTRRMRSWVSEGLTVDNFDPLIGAYYAIFAGAMTTISGTYKHDPLVVMADPEHPERSCPICALVWCHEEHVRLCSQADCDFPKEYDWATNVLSAAADGALDQWRQLGTAT